MEDATDNLDSLGTDWHADLERWVARRLLRMEHAGIRQTKRREMFGGFLSWRFAFRADLDALMRRANETDDFPELVGWRDLLEATCEAPAKQRLDDALSEWLARAAPRRALDFGAGKPRPMHAEVPGRDWTVFEPDPALRPRWTSGGAQLVDADGIDALPEGAFDAVTCSLVLCGLEDAEVSRALGRVRRLLSYEGKAVVAVCEPTSVGVRRTADFERVAGALGYETHETYEKLVLSSGRHRIEHHRPLEAYRRAFARVGLRGVREWTVDGTDVDRLERVSEFRLFELLPLAPLPCTTSLLVKACAMDAATLRDQVRHLVGQLGTPRAFDEVVVTVDPNRSVIPASLRAAPVRRRLGRVGRTFWSRETH